MAFTKHDIAVMAERAFEGIISKIDSVAQDGFFNVLHDGRAQVSSLLQFIEPVDIVP